MKTEFKINVAAILILAVGVAFFFWFRSQKNKEIQTYVDTISHNEFVFETWKSEVDSLDIIQQEYLDLATYNLKQALIRDSVAFEMIDHYKKLSEVVKIETEFVHDTVKVSVPIFINRDTTVILSDDCFNVDLSLSNGLVSLSGLTINNTQHIVVGDKKRGLFTTKQHIMIHNSNPCVTVTGVQAYQIVYEKKWWENPLITVPAGIAIGLVGSNFIK